MTTHASIAQALQAHRSGHLDEAQALYAEILAHEPDHVDALHLLGVIAYQRHSLSEAERYFRRAIEVAPEYAAALSNLGLLLLEHGRWSEAIDCFQASLRVRPDQPGVWSNLGMALVRSGDFAGGATACRTALDYDPASADAHCNLGNALRGMGNPTEALRALEKAVALRPAFAEALNSLGNALADTGMLAAAICAYQRAHECKPEYVSPLNNLAKLHREAGDLEEAERLYRQALARDPHSAEAHWGLSFIHLLNGDWEQGWEEYEWRWQLPDPPDRRTFDTPVWDGTPPGGRKLLVHCEQGLGDAIQFIRYAPLLGAQGAHVLVEAPAALAGLFRTLQGIEKVIPRGEPWPVHDAHCSVLSLPRLARTRPDNVPAAVPYLSVPETLASFWKANLEQDPRGTRIGLAWFGSRTHDNDRKRSLSLDALKPLLAMKGAVFYNLHQERLDPRLLPETGAPFVDHSEDFQDVLATAGLLSQLDLVITVDTMVAHLAGALGKPVWVLLPFAPDWRWMLGRDDSPWYPEMRLFRQSHPGDWDGVIERVVRELSGLPEHRPASVHTGRTDGLLTEAFDSHRAGNLEHARQLYERILREAPDHPDALYLMSVVCRQMDRPEEGLRSVRRLLERDPARADGWNSLGNLLRQCRKHTGAEAAFREALRLDPGYADAEYNVGLTHCDMWNLEEAEQHFRTALSLGADAAKTHNNLGLVYYRKGRHEEAIVEYSRALTADPTNVEAHWNLSHALLHRGDFLRGWAEYEWRWKKPEFQALLRRYTAPRWDGGSLAGKRLLLWTEQGFGDMLHFLRYLPRIVAAGGRVILECDEALHRLVRGMEGIEDVVSKRGALPQHDCQVPLLSVPFVTGDSGSVQRWPGYLSAHPALSERWDARLREYSSRLRVGIVWSGSASNPEGGYRSIPFREIVPLASFSGAVFVNLQKGVAGRAFASSPFAAVGVDWTSELNDFADTAALINSLDLVISVDTAVAHLAGGMGKEVWLLLSKPHDWRWGLGGTTTAWYPSMHLVRQPRHGDWQEVIRQCAVMLETRLSRGKS
ncbi:MAG: tetratricopeptide repeat protein [Bacteroidetes bacterium]|nr:tetratricopeptide repeat protein [Bacteroidota bacterium]